jgi:C1A family cysteine protease
MFTRAIILSLFGAMAAANMHDREYYEEKFVEWMKTHAIKARDGSHFVKMLQTFSDNHDMIAKHNASPEAKHFQMAINKWAHLTHEEWVAQMHLGLGMPDHLPADRIHDAVNGTSNPSEVDWTTKGAVTDVKNQGSCGSCWSFSATGALEGAYQIKNGNLVSFSEQNLVSCDNVDAGCNGGLMDNAFKFMKSNGGLCTEGDYPYVSGDGQNPACDTSCSNQANSKPSGYTDVKKNSDDALMSALVQQPVSVAIQANQPAFQFYSGGVLTGSCGTHLDHGVLAVGYGTWSDGTDYYKVKNSWGPDWGMDGYILIERGNPQRGGECGILMGPPSYPTM